MKNISLPNDLSLRFIRAIYIQLSNAFADEDDVSIDCSTLVTSDLAGLQILVSAMRTAEIMGRSLRLTGDLTALSAALARGGLGLSTTGDQIFVGRV